MIDFPHLNFDISMVLFFNQFCGHSKFLDTLGLLFLSVDAIRTALFVSVIMGIWEYGIVKNDSFSKKRVISILFSIVLTLVTIELMNAVINSPRPIVTYESQIKAPIVVDKEMKFLWKDGWVRNPKHGSFPSDTIALIAAMAYGIFLWRKNWGIIAFIFLFLGGVLPRLYFGLHYPSDMFIGILIAICSTIVIDKVKFLDRFSDTLLSLNEKFPFWFGVFGFYLAYIIADKFILLRKIPLWLESMF